MEIVSALRAAVADKVGKERFELWFGSRARFEWDGDRLTIAVPNGFFQQWLRAKFFEQIQSACRETLGRPPALEFRVDGAVAAPKAAPFEPASGNGQLKPERLADPAPSAGEANGRPAAALGPNGSRRRFADLESFVTGACNQLAHAAAQSVVRQPGELSPLLVHGPTGVGKTHLLEAIWTAARERHPQRTAIYLSAEQFTTGFLQALRGSGLPSFRRKYRGVDLLVLDDLQFFCGKKCTQTELLYTADTLLREGRQLVMAADRPPSELSDLGPELITRLASGIVCRMEPPDYETRVGILAQMARRLAVCVPDDVRQYVAGHLTRHARELSGALCRLQATSQAWGKPITLALAREALADMIRAGTRVVRLADIDQAVCRTFGLEPRALQSRRKSRSITYPRMLAMWLARKYTRSALSEISHYFGRRSHTTVISAQKQVDRWVADGKSLQLADHPCSVDEAIQRVERCLRAG